MSGQMIDIIKDVAAKAGTDPSWLDALINFETAGTYDPQIQNPTDSQARGLIQLRNAAARDLGFSDSTYAVTVFNTFESQMYNVVLPYLQMRIKKYGKLDTLQKLCMSVFYPEYMGVHPGTAFPAPVQAANPGIRTVGDYVEYVKRRVKNALIPIPKAIPVLILTVGTGVLLWWYLRSRRNRR